MTEEEFLSKLQYDILDCDTKLEMTTKLKDIENWDSLAYVNFVLFLKSQGKEPASMELSSTQSTVRDLWDMLQ